MNSKPYQLMVLFGFPSPSFVSWRENEEFTKLIIKGIEDGLKSVVPIDFNIKGE